MGSANVNLLIYVSMIYFLINIFSYLQIFRYIVDYLKLGKRSELIKGTCPNNSVTRAMGHFDCGREFESGADRTVSGDQGRNIYDFLRVLLFLFSLFTSQIPSSLSCHSISRLLIFFNFDVIYGQEKQAG